MQFISQKRKGMTLIELIVALGIFSILSLAILAVFTRQLRVSISQRNTSRLQTDFQSAISLLKWDILMAGYGIPTAQNPLDGQNTNPDVLQLKSVDPPVGGSGKWTFTLISNTGGGSGNAITVRRWNDPRRDIGIGDVITAMPDTKEPISGFPARVTGISTFTYYTPGGDTVSAATLTLNKTVSVGKGNFVFVLPDNPADMTIQYTLQNGSLLRNGLPVLENVEDFEVAYWYDQNQNYIQDAGEWIYDISGLASPLRERIRLVRVSMVVRSGSKDLNYTYPDANITVDDHTYALSQDARHYRRRVYTVSTKVRNLK